MVAPLQGQLEELERELLETNGNAERLARSYNELVELQLVLERAGSFFDETRGRASAAAFESRPAAPDGAPAQLGVFCAVHPMLPQSLWSCGIIIM